MVYQLITLLLENIVLMSCKNVFQKFWTQQHNLSNIFIKETTVILQKLKLFIRPKGKISIQLIDWYLQQALQF